MAPTKNKIKKPSDDLRLAPEEQAVLKHLIEESSPAKVAARFQIARATLASAASGSVCQRGTLYLIRAHLEGIRAAGKRKVARG